MPSRAPWDANEAQALIASLSAGPGAMLPILHALQERYGYIDDAAVPLIAEALNVSKAETVGVISFYHDFRRRPVDGAILKLCRAESCQAAGCEELVARLADVHGIEVDAHDGGPLAIETVYCLGSCALSPAALVDGRPVARLTSQKLDALVERAMARTQ